ncbi:UNKNOWN [Stylonychia lemnae]|uniref:Uncharacterized protein n=1 Tax=Stylonychia lemnae TaxID=5949 RepID=A0A078B2Y1_STYLE|nr:UNKNOWN [Stylonychia lemnae]|eukprot:CDW87592.1 UNKNOWN [Stylonychia lemnae]
MKYMCVIDNLIYIINDYSVIIIEDFYSAKESIITFDEAVLGYTPFQTIEGQKVIILLTESGLILVEKNIIRTKYDISSLNLFKQALILALNTTTLLVFLSQNNQISKFMVMTIKINKDFQIKSQKFKLISKQIYLGIPINVFKLNRNHIVIQFQFAIELCKYKQRSGIIKIIKVIRNNRGIIENIFNVKSKTKIGVSGNGKIEHYEFNIQKLSIRAAPNARGPSLHSIYSNSYFRLYKKDPHMLIFQEKKYKLLNKENFEIIDSSICHPRILQIID